MKYKLLFFFLSSILMACNNEHDEPKNQGDKTGIYENQSKGLYSITIDGFPLKVEIAQTDDSRMDGLMFRENLPENQGMLFAFPYQKILSFWMRNTYIPLDIAFIDENGVIVDIQHMKPLDDSVNYISNAPALYALEVNPGWLKKHDINLGSRVEF